MTSIFFILKAESVELLTVLVQKAQTDHAAVPQGGLCFHGSTMYQAMTAPLPPHGLDGIVSRCCNDQCSLRETCRRWMFRDDPWRQGPPRWEYGGKTCDWKMLVPATE